MGRESSGCWGGIVFFIGADGRSRCCRSSSPLQSFLLLAGLILPVLLFNAQSLARGFTGGVSDIGDDLFTHTVADLSVIDGIIYKWGVFVSIIFPDFSAPSKK